MPPTPLMLAAKMDRVEAATLLLERGADPRLDNAASGKDVLGYATSEAMRSLLRRAVASRHRPAVHPALDDAAICKLLPTPGSYLVRESRSSPDRLAASVYPTDGSGQLSAEEILAAIRRGFGKSSEAEEAVQLMIGGADSDGDGLIDFEEYCRILRS